MSDCRSNLTAAVSLMRMALALLDRDGEVCAAVHLQRSIDLATDAPVPRTVDEMEAWLDEDGARRAVATEGRSPNDECGGLRPPRCPC